MDTNIAHMQHWSFGLLQHHQLFRSHHQVDWNTKLCLYQSRERVFFRLQLLSTYLGEFAVHIHVSDMSVTTVCGTTVNECRYVVNSQCTVHGHRYHLHVETLWTLKIHGGTTVNEFALQCAAYTLRWCYRHHSSGMRDTLHRQVISVGSRLLLLHMSSLQIQMSRNQDTQCLLIPIMTSSKILIPNVCV